MQIGNPSSKSHLRDPDMQFIVIVVVVLSKNVVNNTMTMKIYDAEGFKNSNTRKYTSDEILNQNTITSLKIGC